MRAILSPLFRQLLSPHSAENTGPPTKHRQLQSPQPTCQRAGVSLATMGTTPKTSQNRDSAVTPLRIPRSPEEVTSQAPGTLPRGVAHTFRSGGKGPSSGQAWESLPLPPMGR